MPKIYVINKFQPNPYEGVEVDTTSHGSFKDLSPFYLGPLKDPHTGEPCRLLENYWQYSKVYSTQFDKASKMPSFEYYMWRQKGFESRKAVRYPMGKGTRPIGSLFNNQMLGYLEARMAIYIPAYCELVKHTKSYALLYKWMHQDNRNIILRDFDGFDYHAMNRSLYEVMCDPRRTLGHAFIIAAMLTGEIHKILKG